MFHFSMPIIRSTGLSESSLFQDAECTGKGDLKPDCCCYKFHTAADSYYNEYRCFYKRKADTPLAMLSEGLASVGVGKKSEHLSYRGSDEIGELVKQYNSMVDEIEESAQKLANSEREYAWREMAKQIAHEIKNPLTPMKLNVQQLLKSWNDKVPGF